MFDGDNGGSEAVVGVGEEEEIFEGAVGPGGGLAEDGVGLRETEEIVEGGVEGFDPAEAGGDPI